MTVLENAGTGKCQYWKLTLPEKEGTGKCQYWSVAIRFFDRL